MLFRQHAALKAYGNLRHCRQTVWTTFWFRPPRGLPTARVTLLLAPTHLSLSTTQRNLVGHGWLSSQQHHAAWHRPHRLPRGGCARGRHAPTLFSHTLVPTPTSASARCVYPLLRLNLCHYIRSARSLHRFCLDAHSGGLPFSVARTLRPSFFCSMGQDVSCVCGTRRWRLRPRLVCDDERLPDGQRRLTAFTNARGRRPSHLPILLDRHHLLRLPSPPLSSDLFLPPSPRCCRCASFAHCLAHTCARRRHLPSNPTISYRPPLLRYRRPRTGTAQRQRRTAAQTWTRRDV